MNLESLPKVIEDMILNYVAQMEHREKINKVMKEMEGMEYYLEEDFSRLDKPNGEIITYSLEKKRDEYGNDITESKFLRVSDGEDYYGYFDTYVEKINGRLKPTRRLRMLDKKKRIKNRKK